MARIRATLVVGEAPKPIVRALVRRRGKSWPLGRGQIKFAASTWEKRKELTLEPIIDP